MSPNSIQFLITFFIIFFFYYFPLKNNRKAQNILLLVSSYFFYGYVNWKMIPLLIIVTGYYYFLGILLEKKVINRDGRNKNIFAFTGIITGISLLLYFKYFNFFILSFSDLFESIGLQTNWQTFSIILPLGISFFTFRLISYVIDISKGKIKPTIDFVTFATYIAFFPTMLCGPIDRPNKFIPQLETDRHFNYFLIVSGMRRIMWGLLLKMFLADNAALIVNQIWNNYSLYSGSTIVLCAVFYSFQIYGDFSGYSHMAIGIGEILGFNITENFCYPYFSRNISEFWRRWHISLTSWFMDYIYIPLGGNRCSVGRHFLNTMIVFTICGLWHGANYTFIIWGIYNGLLFLPLVLNKNSNKYKTIVAKDSKFPSIMEFFKILLTFGLVTLGWIIFRATSITDAYLFCKQLFVSPFINLNDFEKFDVHDFIKIIIAIFIVLIVEWIQRKELNPGNIICKIKSGWIRVVVYYIVLYILSRYTSQSGTFIYAQF